MIAVSDTSPLNYLLLIEVERVLPALYERIVIPMEVHRELSSDRSPEPIRKWIAAPPHWLEVKDVKKLSSDPEIAGLDSGEREAISLALELGASSLLIDEKDGREAAKARGLNVTGTLGVLISAASLGLIDLTEAIIRIRQTSYRIDESILQAIVLQNRG